MTSTTPSRAELLIALGVALFGVVGCSCSDQAEEQPKGQCFDYSSFDATTPTVTALELFADAPQNGVIRRGCDAISCHGSDRAPKGGLYLGPPLSDSLTQTPIQMSAAEITTVLTSVVAVASHTAPGLNLIAPNDPQNSFLMMKLDGCLDPVKAECTSRQPGAVTTNPCGDFMPQTGYPLEAADRDKIRRWIAQGASPPP